MQFVNRDIVDLCVIDPLHPQDALCAISSDKTIHILRGLPNAANRFSIALPKLEGRIYRIFSAQGHLIVLTSKCLYRFIGLANRLQSPSPNSGGIPVRWKALEAVDMETMDGRWLLAVMPDHLQVIDIGAPAAESDLEASAEQSWHIEAADINSSLVSQLAMMPA